MSKFLEIGKGSPVMSVALPMYNSKDVSFLAFESLCNQKNVTHEWELIIYEEQHDNMTDWSNISKYIDRLKAVNCTRIVYYTQEDKVNLIDKWIKIASLTHESSVSFLLQAADCYSYSYRIANTYEAINVCDYDWYDNYKGLFYSFLTDKVILYSQRSKTNLSMALKTDLMRKVKTCNLVKGIDGYIYNSVMQNKKGIFTHYYDDILHIDGIDTHGLNNISIKRQSYFENTKPPFEKTTIKLNDTLLPKLIKLEINEITKRLRDTV